MNFNILITMLNPIATAAKKRDHLNGFDPLRDQPTCRVFVTIAVAILLTSCAAYGPYHANTSSEPFNSVRGPKDGRYKLAFIEFGDQGSALDTSQRTAALRVIHEAKRPLLFVYIPAGKTTRSRAMSAGSSTSSIRSRLFPRSVGKTSM